MADATRKTRLAPPLMHVFRAAHSAKDAKKVDMRTESGERTRWFAHQTRYAYRPSWRLWPSALRETRASAGGRGEFCGSHQPWLTPNKTMPQRPFLVKPKSWRRRTDASSRLISSPCRLSGDPVEINFGGPHARNQGKFRSSLVVFEYQSRKRYHPSLR